MMNKKDWLNYRRSAQQKAFIGLILIILAIVASYYDSSIGVISGMIGGFFIGNSALHEKQIKDFKKITGKERMKMNSLDLGLIVLIAVLIASYSNVVKADPLNCSIDNTTTPWNMTCNDNLNTTRINNYFNMDCTGVTADLRGNLSLCQNTTANQTAMIQALQNAMTGNYNYTQTLIDCKQNEASLNAQVILTQNTLNDCKKDRDDYKNQSTSFQTQLSQASTSCNSQLSSKDVECNNRVSSATTTCESDKNNYIYYAIAALAIGIFLGIKQPWKTNQGKEVEKRTGPNPNFS